MTFFQRFRTPFTESAADDQMRSQPRMRLVGEFLQERREDLGLDLEEIGAMLRIKPAYLAALEQGRSRDLPGPAYAIGFVRAYADFLGLDADQVLTRFKAEAAGATAKPDLSLPVPLGERSLPGGALVLVALIVALCGYGIWYYLSTDERDRPQRVAAVPAALQPPPVAPAPALISPGDATAASSPANSTPTPAAPPSPPLFGAAATPANAPPAAQPAASSAPAPAAAASTPVSAAPPGLPPGTTRITAAAAPTQTSATPVASSPGAASTTPAPAANAGSRVAGVMAPAPPPVTTPQPATQPAAPPAAAVKPTPAAPAAVDPSATRISIRALSDCWIQVRASDQSIVFSRVLKSGEIYKVPSRAGLSLRTGNAGALEIAVDGKTAPTIGGIGTLRRDVALDPSELVAGTAVHG